MHEKVEARDLRALRKQVIREITVAPGWNMDDATALVDELILSAYAGQDEARVIKARRDLTAEQWREWVVQAMPWYDEANPDYTELHAVLAALRADTARVEARDLTALTELVAWVDLIDAPGTSLADTVAGAKAVIARLRADTARVPEGLEDALRDLVSLMPADRYGLLRRTTRDFIDAALATPEGGSDD